MPLFHNQAAERLDVRTALAWGVAIAPLFAALVFTPLQQAQAQIRPDQTLGEESSRVVRSRLGDRTIERIDGGTVRGRNLFHSFLDFNIGVGQRVYFSNPAAIENILARVTGGDRSDIHGRLGVLGQANLLLLNPQGFIFGETASLDIRGSFVVSTGDRFAFADGKTFSAIDPEAPPLLQVNLMPGLQLGQGRLGPLENRANLSVDPGQTLILNGGRVDNWGHLTAPGGTLQVLGDRIRLLGSARLNTSSDTDGGAILIGGDVRGQGDLPTARSTLVGPGVDLRARALRRGDGGQVVVWADDTTAFYGRIFAQGGADRGNGGFAEVSGKENLVFLGRANLRATQGEVGTLLLDPANIIIVDGSEGSNDTDLLTDDAILAGDGPGSTFTLSEGILEELSGDSNLILEATNTITLNDLSDDALSLAEGTGSVRFTADADGDGAGAFIVADVADAILTAGRDLTITGATIRPGILNSEGGDITLDASDRLILNNAQITSGDTDSISFLGLSGDILLRAGNGITLTNSLITSDNGLSSFTSGDAGDITLETTRGSIQLNQSELSSSIFSDGTAGNISLTAGDRISISNNSRLVSDAETSGGSFSSLGSGGQISLQSTGDVAIAQSAISAESLNFSASSDDSTISGDVLIRSQSGSIDLDQTDISTSILGTGLAGNISLRAGNQISVRNGSQLLSDVEDSSLGTSGSISGAGQITLQSTGEVAIAQSRISAESFSISDSGSDSGDILIQSETGSVQLDGATVSTSAESSGFAGQIQIDAAQSLQITNASTIESSAASGSAGLIELTAIQDLTVDNSRLSATGLNLAGSISLDANGAIAIRSSTLESDGNLGELRIGQRFRPQRLDIFTSRLSTTNQSASSFTAGDMALRADEIRLTDSQITSSTFGSGDGGSIRIQGTSLIALDGSQINSEVEPFASSSSSSSTLGDGGDITLILPLNDSLLSLANGSRISTNALDFSFSGSGGNGGNIRIRTEFLQAEGRGNNDITANAFSGVGGTVAIRAPGGVFGFVFLTRDDLINQLGTDDPNQLDPIFLPSNDITAISQAGPGLDGEVILNTPDIDPSGSLVNLPDEPEELPSLVSTCDAQFNADGERRGEFIAVGRGGVPIAPDDPLSGDRPLPSWVERDPDGAVPLSRAGANQNPAAQSSASPALVEAQGWAIAPDGRVTLVAMAQAASLAAPPPPSFVPQGCSTH